MILEALVTTTNAKGAVNLAPMGPHVDGALTEFHLRPFHTSRTHANLRDNGKAVVHVTDDAELLARAAIDAIVQFPTYHQMSNDWYVLNDCCRWYALEVTHWLEHPERPTAICRVAGQGRVRDFWGFCRAKHAVLEAAILATRVHLLPYEEIMQDIRRLRPLVEKTGAKRRCVHSNCLRIMSTIAFMRRSLDRETYRSSCRRSFALRSVAADLGRAARVWRCGNDDSRTGNPHQVA